MAEGPILSIPAGPSSSALRKRVKYAVLVVVGFLGLTQLFFSFDWAEQLSALTGQSKLDAILANTPPQDTVETDRACILLDRPFTGASQLDFTRTTLKQWTDCRTLDMISPGWTVQHCTVPGSNPVQVEGQPFVDSPSCYPGGYFRIQRVLPSSSTTTTTTTTTATDAKDDDKDSVLETGTCHLKKDALLSKDPATNQYATSFLGPDTFRIILTGPERVSLMQQQSLGDCTYAIPYLISRPGRFWVHKILHTYSGYDALNEVPTSDTWLPQYLGTDLITAEARQQQGYYHFDVCLHCVSWVAIDEAQGLGGTKDICVRTASAQSRQYGIYTARMPIDSVRQAVSHPYKWIPARPRCRFFPDPAAFAPKEQTDSDDVVAEKEEAAQCLQKKRSIYFVGDSHVRMLFTGVMQRLQGKSGRLELPIQDRETHVLKAGNVEARSDFDASLDEILARVRYFAGAEQDGSVKVPDVEALEAMDTVVMGFGSFAGHWSTAQFTDRIKTVLEGLKGVRDARQMASGGDKVSRMSSLKVIWVGIPAWTDDTLQATTAGWKTNHRNLYWNRIVDGLINGINTQVGGQGMVDRLSTFEITLPFKNTTQDHLHYTSEIPIDSLSAELIHKLDLCS
ncbi:hypothetical protein EDD11_008893 [Mortierella claussenii]|nr:hypothetical protein EDD11_008893 [Mortierella claussenii]